MGRFLSLPQKVQCIEVHLREKHWRFDDKIIAPPEIEWT
jgi:hypothetical protein